MKISFNQYLPEVHDEPVKSETIEVKSVDTNRVMGRIIHIPEVTSISNKVKCRTLAGEESFLYSFIGRMYLDFEDNLIDVVTEGETTVVLLEK